MAPENDSAPETPEIATGSAHTPAPPSWKAILIGLVFAGLAAAAAAGLIAGYLDSRPVDFHPLTEERIADLDRLFAYNQVPAARIEKTAVEERRDETARWAYCDYKVDLPPELSVSGMERLLRRTMAERNVSVFDEPDQPEDTRVLRFSTAGKHFATVALTGVPDRRNLTEPARRLAQEVVHTLTGMAPVVERFERGTVEPQENEDTLWERVAVDAWVVSKDDVDTVAGGITTALSRDDVEIRVESLETTGQTKVTVFYMGLECVRITLHAPVAPSDMLLDGESLAGESETSDEEPPAPVPDPESLPLESEHLNGDATAPAMPQKPKTAEGPLRAAIIVDDGGYGGEIGESVLSLDPRLTLSILPWAPHSTDTAQRATELGFEVMLHMPMENSSDHNTFPGQLTVGMPAEEVHRLTKDALEDVPGAAGINNHTGSRFTSDAASMRAFLEGIKPLDLFFIDSRTISTSTAFEIAQEMDIPSASRDLFLDHESDKTYIRERFNQLIELTKKQGTAIGICHFRRTSVEVLREMLPEFEKAGIEIVHVSELIE